MSLVALGVTGGIGAYKSVEVCRGLQKQGHDVVAVMTRAATRFVGPLTFEAITRHPVITSQWKPGANADIEHIALADNAALLLVAPCTANIIGKFANGIADDFLTSLYLATKAPVLLAPAMNTNMLAHEAVQRNDCWRLQRRHWPDGQCSSPPDPRMRTSIPSASSGTARAAGWDLPWRRRRGGAARMSRSWPARRRSNRR